MLKIAVIGAGSLLGRELVDTLEARECSVLPLSQGPMTRDEEFGDLVMFAPEPALMEDIDLVILAETPAAPNCWPPSRAGSWTCGTSRKPPWNPCRSAAPGPPANWRCEDGRPWSRCWAPSPGWWRGWAK